MVLGHAWASPGAHRPLLPALPRRGLGNRGGGERDFPTELAPVFLVGKSSRGDLTLGACSAFGLAFYLGGGNVLGLGWGESSRVLLAAHRGSYPGLPLLSTTGVRPGTPPPASSRLCKPSSGFSPGFGGSEAPRAGNPALLPSLAGHGRNQSVFARAGAVAEISRSGDGDDHNKGWKVRDEHPASPSPPFWGRGAGSSLVHACLWESLCSGLPLRASPRVFACSVDAQPLLPRAPGMFVSPVGEATGECRSPHSIARAARLCPGTAGPSLRGYIEEKLFLLALFLTRTVGSLIPISGLWKLSRQARVATTWPRANLV